MRTNSLPMLAVLLFGWIVPLLGQPESVLPLEERGLGAPPFHKGDQLDIRGDATVFSGLTRLTVLDTAHWPWVLVKSEQGETWLNFGHVLIAKNVVPVK